MSLGPIALLPLAQAGYGGVVDDVLPPTLLVILCVVAGVGTWMLLPSRNRAAAMRGLGGTLILLSGLVLGLMLIRYTAQNSAAAGPGIYFWIFSGVAILGALRVVTHPRPVYAALYFVLTVFATAGLFILLWAEFMAAALVIIYAGAILVTYVFVIMLAASTIQGGVEKLNEYDAYSRDPIVASAVGFALAGVMLFVIFDKGKITAAPVHAYTFTGTKAAPNGRTVEVSGEVVAPSPAAANKMMPYDVIPEANRLPEPAFSMQALGRYLFRDQAIGLELAGLILTLGMVGAILIARRRVVHPADARLPAGISHPRAHFTAPATPISDDPYSIPVYGTDNPAQKAYPET